MYQYVSKKEYGPTRDQLLVIIHKVQDLLRKEFTFQYKLIGSGQRHLITRVEDGNKGYDFDYNLIIQTPEPGTKWNPDVVKKHFMNAFREAVKDTEYKDPQDSTSVITIKVVEELNSKIVHSCDFAIIYYPEDDGSHYYKYIRHDKRSNQYTWENRALSHDSDEKVKWIIKNMLWEKLKTEYLLLKNANKDKDKRSFSLYLEAVNNIFNLHYID